MSGEAPSSPRFGRDWSDLAAGRKWSGLPPRLWRLARGEGHHLHDGQPGESFSMNRGFHCPCGRWAVHLASMDRHLMAQYDDLHGEVGVAAADEPDELKHAAKHAIEERDGHCWMLAAPRSSRQSAAHSRWMAFSAPTGRHVHPCMANLALRPARVPAVLPPAAALAHDPYSHDAIIAVGCGVRRRTDHGGAWAGHSASAK